MRLHVLVIAALLVATANATPQTPEPQGLEHTDVDPEAVELYTKALTALLGGPKEVGLFYLADRLRGEGGRVSRSPLPEVIGEELNEAGYEVQMAELAENGLWQVPRGQLFVMLREIEWWPGKKMAEFSIDAGAGATNTREIAFKFKKEDGEHWVLIEKGPPESE